MGLAISMAICAKESELAQRDRVVRQRCSDEPLHVAGEIQTAENPQATYYIYKSIRSFGVKIQVLSASTS